MATDYERLKKIVTEHLHTDEKEIKLEASFTEDLNADSLDMVELMTAVEKEFSHSGKRIEISDEDAEKMQTIQSTLDFLNTTP